MKWRIKCTQVSVVYYEEILCVIGWSALLKTKVCKRLYLFVILLFYQFNRNFLEPELYSVIIASVFTYWLFSGSDKDQGKLLISDIELACADLETLPSPGKLDGGWMGVVVPMDKFVCGRFYACLWLLYYVDLNISNYSGTGSWFQTTWPPPIPLDLRMA